MKQHHDWEAIDSISLSTSQGYLVGARIEGHPLPNPVIAFKGIPYALPPVGHRRWRPAEPPLPWQGDRLALDFSPSPMQPAVVDRDQLFYSPAFAHSEDCLYANVWVPETAISKQSAGRLPVMVWIYGGGLLVGSSSNPEFDGAALAAKGVVVVTFNYRLGVFSHFAHPALSAESPHDASGNYGTTDQIQLLRWVKASVAAFGGDPDNVTLFGESAGALSISHLMASPLSAGLFHKVIMQSSYLPLMPALRQGRYGFQSAEDYGKHFASTRGIEGKDRQALDQLRELPAESLLQASQAFDFDKAIVDGWVFPQQVFDAFEQGKINAVPMIAGFNQQEGSYFPRIGVAQTPASVECYISTVKQLYGDLADEYLSVYPASDLDRAAWAPIGEGFYAWGTHKLAQLTARRAPVFFYRYDHIAAWAKAAELGAVHGSEVYCAFNNVHPRVSPSMNQLGIPASERDTVMAEVISDYWVAFATHGVPAVDQLCDWPAYKEGKEDSMRFRAGRAHLGQDVLLGTLALHEKIMSRRRTGNSHWTHINLGVNAPVLPQENP